MSARISGVKNFESQKISFVRGLPFSQVQSASENGSILATLASAGGCACGAAAAVGTREEELSVGATAFTGAIGATGIVAFAVVTGGVGCSVAFKLLSSACNSSMRFRIASSSL